MSPELTAQKHAALAHVNIVRGQLDEVARMLESDAHCVDVMKQIQMVQWDRGGAHGEDRGLGATTSGTCALPGEREAVQAKPEFVDGDGI